MDQPFHDLDVFKEKIARNVASISSQDKLAALLQADKDAEAVLMSLLKGHMLDLYEALSWQYASKEVRLLLASNLLDFTSVSIRQSF